MKKRKSSIINLNKRVLILCEGESEVIYLKGLKTTDENRRRLSAVDIEIYQPRNFSPLGLVNEAKKRIREAKSDKLPYFYVWVVFDKDIHANIPQAMNDALTYKIPINIAFSVICFEFWILLHFEKTTRYFANCDSLISYREKKKYISNYSKTGNLYKLLKGKEDIAIKNSNWCIKQNAPTIRYNNNIHSLSAYTDFHYLFLTLNTLNRKP